MSRRGLTLVELLITMAVVAVLGTALVRLLMGNSRFVNRQDAMMDARMTARAAMNIMVPELRMVSDGGLESATATSVVVRVPYAFGITCRADDENVIASLVPTDSVMFAAASPDGMAWLVDSTGAYAFLTGITVSSSSEQDKCDDASVTVLAGGQLIEVDGALDEDQVCEEDDGDDPEDSDIFIPCGSILYLYQRVTFAFAASVELPGRIGLWRQAGSGPNEELAWPFDAAAGFGFLVESALDPLAAPPADLTTVHGLELKLLGESELVAQGDAAPREFDLPTRITFMNTVR